MKFEETITSNIFKMLSIATQMHFRSRLKKSLVKNSSKKSKNLRKNSCGGNKANLEKIAGREYCALTGVREYNENDHSLKYGT